jgi:hypothetical protein
MEEQLQRTPRRRLLLSHLEPHQRIQSKKLLLYLLEQLQRIQTRGLPLHLQKPHLQTHPFQFLEILLNLPETHHLQAYPSL